MTVNQIEQPSNPGNIDGNKIMPTGDGNNIPDQWAIESTSAYRDIHQLSVYDLMLHTYNGSNGYRDCSYLIPSIRDVFYERRRKMSYYVNIFKPMIDAMITPVFNSTIERDFGGSEDLETFANNCDNAGTKLTPFVRNAITSGRIFSLTFVVVENFSEEQISKNEKENKKNRIMPYIYEKIPQEVDKWSCNKQGALETITFIDRIEEVEDKKGAIKRYFYRYWDSNNWREYYIDNPVKGKENIEIETESGSHGLGVLPVIPVLDFARSNDLRTFPIPELYSLAILCHALFQKESQVVMGELYQTFSLLYVSNWNKTGLQAGATNFIDCGSDAKFPPGYAAPPQEGLRTVISNCERLKEEIRNQAQQNGITGLKESQSGLAKQWDFLTKAVVLTETAMAAESLEIKIFELVQLYMKTQHNVMINYHKKYEPNAETIRLGEMFNIIDKIPSGPLNEEAQKEILRLLWKHDQKLIDGVIVEMNIDNEEKDAIRAMMNEENKNKKTDGEEINNENKKMEGGV